MNYLPKGILVSGLAALCAAGLCADGIAGEKDWPTERLRGINTFVDIKSDSGFLDEAYFKKLKEWNVNSLRVGLSVDRKSPWDVKKGEPLPPIPEDNPMKPYEKGLKGLEQTMALAEKYHIYIIPTLHDVVGRKNDVMLQAKDNDTYYNNVFPIWKYIAEKYGKNKWLIAYDILNEPNGINVKTWTDKMAQECIDKIREIDKDTYIIYEPAPWALPDQAFESIRPLKDDKLIYSFHFYYPHTYTHQNINSYKTEEFKDKPYPGELKMFPDSKLKYWDKAALEESMANAIAFQKKHNVKMYIGEFGVLRWAPGNDKWLKDTLEIFEKYGWDWSFHSYGEWNGWNPTFGPADPSGSQPDGGKITPSLELLLKYWKSNKTF